MEKTVFFHVDIDSPKTLMRFWGVQGIESDLDSFYEVAMQRALAFFKSHGIAATFFCVGKELEQSAGAWHWIQRACREDHEIANHTYTHPYGLTRLSAQQVQQEIARCSDVIQEAVGARPIGFRAPSYDMNQAVFDRLPGLGFLYDSSATWSSLLPFVKAYYRLFSKKPLAGGEFGHCSVNVPEEHYFPARGDWTQKSAAPRDFIEIPITRTSLLHLPFYNHFHLLAGDAYRRLAFSFMMQTQIVYLMHLIEFVDLKDGIPAALKVHLNLSTPFEKKIAFLDRTVQMILSKYKAVRSDRFVTDKLARRLPARPAHAQP